MADIGYLDALQMWFSGNSALQDSTMYGLGMLWWGRFGKIAAFLGGMTVVLDILGPERIREYGGRLRAVPRSRTQGTLTALTTGGGAIVAGSMAAAVDVAMGLGSGRLALAVLIATIVLAVGWVAISTARSKLFENTLKGVAWVLEHPKSLGWWRVISLLGLVVGFHFDLLAS
ncbi:hypothetical protein AB0L65_49605 [Nonomuraea sp. NPDC052116]|uniref:hypothetical protein n=1 Tax=Nonomuraea sp. NPDC052116 TaxID=3155665 RepID=UPI003417E869